MTSIFSVILSRLIYVGFLGCICLGYGWIILSVMNEIVFTFQFEYLRAYSFVEYILYLVLFRTFIRWVWKRFFTSRFEGPVLVGLTRGGKAFASYQAFQTGPPKIDIQVPEIVSQACRTLSQNSQPVIPKVHPLFVRYFWLRPFNINRVVYPGEFLLPLENIVYKPTDLQSQQVHVFRPTWQGSQVEILLAVQNMMINPASFKGMRELTSRQWDQLNEAIQEYFSSLEKVTGVTPYHTPSYLNIFLQAKFIEQVHTLGIISQFRPIKMQEGSNFPILL